WMRRATPSSFSRVRPVRMTVAPSSARPRAAASPMPLPAPVTQAIFPVRSANGGFLQFQDAPHSTGPAASGQPRGNVPRVRRVLCCAVPEIPEDAEDGGGHGVLSTSAPTRPTDLRVLRFLRVLRD